MDFIFRDRLLSCCTIYLRKVQKSIYSKMVCSAEFTCVCGIGFSLLDIVDGNLHRNQAKIIFDIFIGCSINQTVDLVNYYNYGSNKGVASGKHIYIPFRQKPEKLLSVYLQYHHQHYSSYFF
jgi:hypothetical protein